MALHTQPVAARRIYPVRYERGGTAQSIANSGVRVDFNTQIFDPYSLVTTGASWVYTCPETGYYQVSASVSFFALENWSAGFDLDTRVFINTTQEVTLNRIRMSVAKTADRNRDVVGSALIYCSKNDTIHLKAYHQETGTRDISTGDGSYISIHYIGAS